MISRNTQQGLTLIEILVAMTLSMVIIAGIGTVYLSSKHTYETRDQMSVMDENARVALEALTKHLEHAGYGSVKKLPINQYFYVSGDPNITPASCGAAVSNVSSTLNLGTFASRSTRDNYLAANGDSVSVRFAGDASVFTDCANGILPPECRAESAPSMQATLIYNTFFVDKDSNGLVNLYCSGTRNSSATSVAQGIENMQFLYGVDTDDNGSADQYLNATAVGAAGEWQQVVSIKVALLVRSLDVVLPSNTAQSYTLLDVNKTYNDRYQRAVYTTVIHLRNAVDG